jgi:hypothetical protein
MKGKLCAWCLLSALIPIAAAGDVRIGVAVGHGWGYGPVPLHRPYLAPRVWVPPYYRTPPAYYVAPEVVLATEAPVHYVERGDTAVAAPAGQSDWYYCRSPQGYYPEIQTCPGGWMRAPARPVDAR